MIHIALTIDRKFVDNCAVTMVSILHNNRPEDIVFHILSQGLVKENTDFLKQVAGNYGAAVHFYDIPDEKIQGYEIRWEGKRLSKVVFFRCILASVLSKDISRVLYLDCDVLVLGSLQEFWDVDLEGKALAGIQDTVRPHPTYFVRLRYDESFSYFNGGVLLLNLDYWRQHDIERKSLEYYIKYPDRVLLNDQDVLNAVLYDQKLLVDIKWNVQDDFYRRKRFKSSDWRDEYTEAILHPVILHFSGRKPWAYHAMHPLRHLYFKYRDMTPLSDTQQFSRWDEVHRFIHLLPYTLRLKKQKYVDLKEVERCWNDRHPAGKDNRQKGLK